jgi:hypothetical protein
MNRDEFQGRDWKRCWERSPSPPGAWHLTVSADVLAKNLRMRAILDHARHDGGPGAIVDQMKTRVRVRDSLSGRSEQAPQGRDRPHDGPL